ncbi:MAG TPA: Gfo/Idh/MocA family oxidoreductase [bacterium]|nr:Gfo/Idh/MocA family oxidoreductase [bacterium]
MKKTEDRNRPGKMTRREFMKATAAVPVLMFSTTTAFAQGQTIRVGLIGCGGRGTYDTTNCLNAAPNVELAAMGDLFGDHLEDSFTRLKERVGEKVKVTDKTKFVGFDAYEGVLASDVDLVILTSTPHFRPRHLKAAINAGKHVFMEKPVAVDPVGVRTVIAASEQAEQKGLTIVGGTQMRRATHIREAMDRIHGGDIGDLVGGQCCRWGGAMSTWGPQEREQEWSDMEWQIRNWYFYTWLSGDFITEMHIHNLDLINWAFDSPPVSCSGFGGRQARTGPEVGKWGNIYDHFSVEFLYPGEVRVEYIGTQIDNTVHRNNQRLVGTNGTAYIDFGEVIVNGARRVELERGEMNPAVQQHADQIEAIRKGRSLNEGRRVAESTLTTIMGRMSCYTGQTVDWDWVLNESQLDLSPPAYAFGDLEIRPEAVPGMSRLV